MFGKISRFLSLFKIYGFHAFHLIINPVLGRPIWIPLGGRKVWLNFDSATYYHLIHSTDKVKTLVDALPKGLQGDIIDGGANHGVFSLLVSQKFPLANVYALEPYHKVLPILKKNVEGMKVSVVEKALSDKDGEVVFYTDPASDQVGSILLDNLKSFVSKNATIGEHKVPAISLNSLVESKNISQIAILKLDIQGAEFAILEYADAVLERTECLVLEVILLEPTSLALLEKAKRFFPYHKALNPIAYGADIIFSKAPL